MSRSIMLRLPRSGDVSLRIDLLVPLHLVDRDDKTHHLQAARSLVTAMRLPARFHWSKNRLTPGPYAVRVASEWARRFSTYLWKKPCGRSPLSEVNVMLSVLAWSSTRFPNAAKNSVVLFITWASYVSEGGLRTCHAAVRNFCLFLRLYRNRTPRIKLTFNGAKCDPDYLLIPLVFAPGWTCLVSTLVSL